MLTMRKRVVLSKEKVLTSTLLFLIAGALIVTILFPLLELLIRSLHNSNGNWIGLANYHTFFATPSLSNTLSNTLFVSVVTALTATAIGFLFAYGLTRTAIPGKTLFKTIAIAPLFAPSMMHGIALIYLFGNKGIITTGFFGKISGLTIDLYGPLGIIMAEFFFVFPKAVLILTVALSIADMRLYDAAKSMGASKIETFLKVTVPSMRFALLSTLFVTFTLTFTDFGAPKVVGGQYNVLAVDVYKRVIGQQDFSMGAALSLVLLIPTLFAFVIERIVAKNSAEAVGSKATVYRITPNRLRDTLAFFVNSAVSLAIVLLLGVVLYASLVKAWPYDFSLTLQQFDFTSSSGSLSSWINTLQIAGLSALFGGTLIFLSAWLIEKQKLFPRLRALMGFISLFPTAIPGTVIGLAFIFFFNRPDFIIGSIHIPNPFSSLYGTIWILVIANIVHFMPVTYLTATTALKKLDKEFEPVAESLGVPVWKLFFKVTVPLCIPALLEMFSYLFISSMTTVSAVIFLYSAKLKPASVSIVDMEDAGDTASAAALAVLILLSNMIIRIAYQSISKLLLKKTSRWKEATL